MRRKTRVLIIDNDPRVREGLCDILTLLEYQVAAPRGAGRALIQAVMECIKTFRPHVAVVDLRLQDDGLPVPDGLGLLEHLKPARCIIYSAFPDVEVTREAFKKHHVFYLVNKGEDPDILLEYIDQAARGVCAAQRGMVFGNRQGPCAPERVMETLGLVHRDEPGAAAGEGVGAEDLPEDLLAILFPEETSLSLRPVESGPVTSEPTVRGRTVVCTAQREGKLEVELVKFAPAEKIEREVQNYQNFIDLNLGGFFRPNLENHATFYELGGAVYTFLGHPKAGRLQTFAERYLDDPQAALDRPLDHFFLEVWNGLYQWKQEQPVSLYEAYDQCLGLTKKLKAVQHRSKPSIPGLPIDLPDPFAWLSQNRNFSSGQGKPCFGALRRGASAGNSFRRRGGPAAPQVFALTHGDLHAGNLLVDGPGEHAWTIDFERTGYGPNLRDFVELEVDIATRLVDASNENPRDFLELAFALCAPAKTGEPLCLTETMNEATRRGMALIAHLRDLAGQVTASVNPREYTFGILCDAIYVACKEEPGTRRYNRAVMLAAAACLNLTK